MTDNLEDLKRLDLPFDITKVDPQCHKCVREQLKKYEKAVDKDGKPLQGKFIVPCKGIALQKIDPVLEAKLSSREALAMKAMKDPVLFAELYIKNNKNEPWIARDPHQTAVLRCTSKRKCLRISRRAGKCVSGRSKVLTENGPIFARDLINNPVKVATFDPEQSKIVLTDNYTIWTNGIKDVYELTLDNGRRTYVTDNHPFLTISTNGILEWNELKDLKEGTNILVPDSYEGLIQGIDIGNNESRLLGYLIGDGGTSYKYTCRFTNMNNKTIKDISDILNDYDCELVDIIGSDKGNYNIVAKDKDRHKKYRNQVNWLANKYNIRKLAIHKEVPKEIFNSTEENISNFLGAYWDCDGWCSVSTPCKDRKFGSIELGCGTSSEKLAYGISHLLLRLGVSSRLKKKKVKYKEEYRDSWQITIGDIENIIKFSEKVKLVGKGEDLKKVLNYAKNFKNDFGKDNTIPKEIYNYIKDTKGKRSKRSISYDSKSGKYISYSPQYAPSKNKLSIFAENLDDEYLRGLCSSEIRWSKIKSIKFVGKEETYDLSVEGTNTLITDDIISHNTDLVVIEIIFSAFTQPNQRILVIGPQKKHAQEIFNRVKEKIYSNPFLANSVVKDVASPHSILKFKNKSEIRGFAGGTKGKGDGVAVRGEDADKVFIEECAYVDESSIQGAILPILQTNPDVTLCAFSTPSALRTTTFFKFCKESPNYKEFHYDYKILPWWKQIEEDSSMLTEEEFATEYLAIFPEAGGGVYRPSYIERALQLYEYKDMKYNPLWKYTIGVDWNEKHGAEIVVLGRDPVKQKLQVVDAYNVGGDQFTQLASVEKVIEYNRKWRPNFIYVDAGNGSTNAELLLKRSIDAIGNPDLLETAKIKERLRKYDSGAAIEVHDVTTNQKIKKPAKPFMVGCSVRMFEQNKILISASDHILKAQLENYIIERINPNGNPVYGLEKESVMDHRLDALNLAIVAFHIHFDELHKRNLSTAVSFAPDPRNTRLNDKGEYESIITRPEVRDNGEDFLSIEEKQLAYSSPGRVDLKKIKTNRLGWDTDQEELRMQEYLARKQRKRSQTFRNSFDRPRRPNI